MLKICGDTTINKPLELIFKQPLITGTYVNLFTKKARSRILKSIAQCLYYQYVAKLLKRFYLIMFSSFQENNPIKQSNPDLNLATLVETNCYQLLMKFTNL